MSISILKYYESNLWYVLIIFLYIPQYTHFHTHVHTLIIIFMSWIISKKLQIDEHNDSLL